MAFILYVLVTLVLAWVFIYTISYGVWTWKKNNKSGAVAVFFIAAVSLMLPIYQLFIKKY